MKDNGDKITIDAGTTAEVNFDLDIYQLAYCYSFFQDDRIDLAAGIGFGIPCCGGVQPLET